MPFVSANVYREVLGARWADVSSRVRGSHLSAEELHAECLLDIAGASNAAGRCIARLVSFPAARSAAQVSLTIRAVPEGELWEREFPDCVLRSVQSAGNGGFLVDRFRYIAFWFRLEAAAGGIRHRHTRTYLHWGALALRVPMMLSPRILSFEEPDAVEEASRITVHVTMPVLGHLLTYKGIVRPVKKAA